MTLAEAKAALARLQAYKGEYLGLAEIADIMGVSKQNASNRRKRDQLPPVLQELKMSPIWNRTGVYQFLNTEVLKLSYAMNHGDKVIVDNLRRSRGDELQPYSDEQVAKAYREFSLSEDYPDESKLINWIGE